MTLATREVRWGAGGRMIVDGVTLEAAPGRVLGLIGPNGSGKSSLLRLLCRLRNVASGVVTLDGNDIAAVPRRELARRLAFVEQQATTEMQLSVCNVVRLGRTPHRANDRARGTDLRAARGARVTAARDALLAKVVAHYAEHGVRDTSRQPRGRDRDESANAPLPLRIS